MWAWRHDIPKKSHPHRPWTSTLNFAYARLVTLAPGLRSERRFAPLARGLRFQKELIRQNTNIWICARLIIDLPEAAPFTVRSTPDFENTNRMEQRTIIWLFGTVRNCSGYTNFKVGAARTQHVTRFIFTWLKMVLTDNEYYYILTLCCCYKEIIVIFRYISILCYVKVSIGQNSMSKNVWKVHLDMKRP